MTSKEQAHVLAKEAAFAISNNTLRQYHNEPMVQRAIDMNTFRIVQAIPLTELLEVAKAASGLAMGSDWNNGTHAKDHGYREKLLNALSALSATGKVKL